MCRRAASWPSSGRAGHRFLVVCFHDPSSIGRLADCHKLQSGIVGDIFQDRQDSILATRTLWQASQFDAIFARRPPELSDSAAIAVPRCMVQLEGGVSGHQCLAGLCRCHCRLLQTEIPEGIRQNRGFEPVGAVSGSSRNSELVGTIRGHRGPLRQENLNHAATNRRKVWEKFGA